MPVTVTTDTGALERVARELFHQGRRTVSFNDFVKHYGREFDANFIRKVVELLPDVARRLETGGLPVTLVNRYCLQAHAETPVTTEAEARRCNVMNSGGKDPVGIRRALSDDLVRSEVNGTLAHMHSGGWRHAVKSNVNDVSRGISPPESHTKLVATLRAEVPQIADITPDAAETPLFESNEP